MRFFVLVFLAGCGLYWNEGGGGGGGQCNGIAEKEPAQQVALDPSTGQCVQIGTPGGGCTDPCLPCVSGGVGSGSSMPEWPACAGTCSNLTEQQCLGTASCHAEYQELVNGQQFVACWEMVASVQHDGLCQYVDAWTCADHDNCASLMKPDSSGQLVYDRCVEEPQGLCSVDSDCLGPDVCDTSVCHMAPCTNCPTCGACAPTCYGICAPAQACDQITTEAACVARADCEPLYMGSDCTCIGNVCTCKTETFESCAPR